METGRSAASAAFVIRDAVTADLPALADLHVRTFDETHGRGPSVAVRERQWRELFDRTDGSQFVLVIAAQDGTLVGFARGERYIEPEPPGFRGLLDKVYILRAQHRQGLGRRLFGHVARRFLDLNISSMLLFGDSANASNGFYEVMQGERLFAPNGEFHGAYGWRDLVALASICPAD